MKEIETDGFQFRFTDAIDAFVFDEKDAGKPTFHGVPMKAVDIIAEFKEAYVFIELKDYDDPSIYDIRDTGTVEELTFDNALNSRLQKLLKSELPVGKVSERWKQALAESCQVVNVDKWNENFPKWPVARLAESVAPEGHQR